jgi:DNA-binding NarL/FixJ family response regulator
MRVLLVEAQALVREGLKQVTLQVDAACEFIEAGDAATARAVLRDAAWIDAAWIDVADFTAAEFAAIRSDRPAMMLLALTTCADAAALDSLLGAGINVLVPKSASTDIMAATLRLAIAGNVCVRGSHAGRPCASFPGRTTPGSRRGTGPLNLTFRQYDVLALIAQDRSNKAIAGELGIGLRTVKGHMSVILRALRVDNRADAGRVARRWLARPSLAKGPPAPSA